MMGALAAVMLAVAAVISYKAVRTPINAGSITAAAWLLVLLLAMLPGALVPGLVSETQQVFFWVGVSALGFSVGWASAPSATEPAPSTVSRRRLLRAHKVLVVLLIAGVALDVLQLYPVIEQLGGFQALWSGDGGGADFRLAALQKRQADVESGETLISGLLGYLFAPGLMSFVTGALLWKDRQLLAALVPLGVVAVRSVVLLERTTLMMGVLLFVMTLGTLGSAAIRYSGRAGLKPLSRKPRSGAKTIALSLIGVSIVTAMLLPLLARNEGTSRSTGIASLAQYLLSSVAGLNATIIDGTAFLPAVSSDSTMTGAYPGFGAYTFYGAFDLLRRFGFPLPHGTRLLDYTSVSIFGSEFTTNTRTMVHALHMDFGEFGGYLVLFMLFLLCGAFGRAIKLGNIRLLGIHAVLAGSLVWSFFVVGMLAGFRYLFAAICSYWILGWIAHTDDAYGAPERPTRRPTRLSTRLSAHPARR